MRFQSLLAPRGKTRISQNSGFRSRSERQSWKAGRRYRIENLSRTVKEGVTDVFQKRRPKSYEIQNTQRHNHNHDHPSRTQGPKYTRTKDCSSCRGDSGDLDDQPTYLSAFSAIRRVPCSPLQFVTSIVFVPLTSHDLSNPNVTTRLCLAHDHTNDDSSICELDPPPFPRLAGPEICGFFYGPRQQRRRPLPGVAEARARVPAPRVLVEPESLPESRKEIP